MITKRLAADLLALVKSIDAASVTINAAAEDSIPGASPDGGEVQDALSYLRTADRHLTYAATLIRRRGKEPERC